MTTAAADDLTTHQRRIVALLAKAESTTFEAEAQALYAKAQELMTRYAIDAAALGAGLGRPETVPLHRPVGSGAAALLMVMGAVAAANRCVLLDRRADLALVGFADDVGMAALLITSVQAQMLRGYTRQRHTRPAGVHGNTFRASYLLGYASVVCQRLREANAATEQQAREEGQSQALALLDDRRDRVLDHLGPTRPARRSRPTVGSAEGFDRGTTDGRTADLLVPAVE